MTPQIRGYALKQTAKFVETRFDAETRRRISDLIPPSVRNMMSSFEPGEWYPREYSSAMLRGIAAATGTEAGAYQDLIQCGEYIATEATNTFLKLLMRVMSPTLFAKKIPEFWKRDQRGGYFEADLSRAEQSVITLRLDDVAGYDHIGVVSIGWIKFGMTALGKPGVKVEQRGWSLDRPGPKQVDYEISWS